MNSPANLARILRWTARIWGICSSLVVLTFVFGGREHLRFTAGEAALFLLFPVGVITGFAVAWRRELTGGLITAGSITLFYVVMTIDEARARPGVYFLLLAAPGFLHIASHLIAPPRARKKADGAS